MICGPQNWEKGVGKMGRDRKENKKWARGCLERKCEGQKTTENRRKKGGGGNPMFEKEVKTWRKRHFEGIKKGKKGRKKSSGQLMKITGFEKSN